MKILHTTTTACKAKPHREDHTESCIYLDFYVADFGGGADDGSADQGGEDVGREVRACIATLDKLCAADTGRERDGRMA